MCWAHTFVHRVIPAHNIEFQMKKSITASRRRFLVLECIIYLVGHLSLRTLYIGKRVYKKIEILMNPNLTSTHWCLSNCSHFVYINTLRPRQNGRHFADDTFKRIFLYENVRISIKISMKFVPKGPVNNIWTNAVLFTDANMRHSASMS